MTSVRQRPALWSYLSFNTRHDRSSSISSQYRPNDPHEKANRFSDSAPADNANKMSNRWVKTVVLVVIFCVALFFLGPKDSITKTENYISGTLVSTLRGSLSTFLTAQPDHRPLGKSDGQTASDPSLGTTKCLKSSSKHKPIVQYALMVDAGSTGSRIHVYRFNNCGDTPELEHEDFKMIKPGLSSFKEDAEGAAKSLDELLEVAMKSVPDKLKSCTPIAVKATAGLRLLGEEMSKKILEAVKNRLDTKYPFPVIENGVTIMDGKDEGTFPPPSL
jgi:guanosine-diphosphatase